MPVYVDKQEVITMHSHYNNGPALVRRARKKRKQEQDRYIRTLEEITLTMCSVVVILVVIITWKCL